MGLRIDPWKTVDAKGKPQPLRTYPTEYWTLENGWLACITSDKEIAAKIRRYYADRFEVMAKYYDEDTRRLLAIQWRVPARHRRVVYRLFGR